MPTKLSEEVKEIFSITADMKEMQERLKKLIVLVLGALCSEFLRARPNVIGNSTVKSLEYLSLFT